jgi:DoxX-like family
MTNAQHTSLRPRLHRALWMAQWFLALTFVGGGLWKLVTPIPELASKMPWMGQVSRSFLTVTAALDLLGGLGVLLPSLTRVQPRITVLAALGCAALMVGAISFHVQRGEAANTPFNFLLAGSSAFVAWGRLRQAPIAPRSSGPTRERV